MKKAPDRPHPRTGRVHPADRLKWAALFALWALHGLVALAQFPGAFGRGGLSPSPAWLPAGFLLLVLVGDIYLLLQVLWDTPRWAHWRAAVQRPAARDALLLGAGSIALAAACLLLLGHWSAMGSAPGPAHILSRLAPLTGLGLFLPLEAIVLLALTGGPIEAGERRFLQRFSGSWLAAVLLLGAVALIIAVTGLGIEPEYKGDWARGLPAVPLLEWQILLACGALLGIAGLEAGRRLQRIPRLDLWLCVFIWSFTCLFWLSQPVTPSASALKPHEPNFEIYPFIDAQTFDVFAQSALVGKGYGEGRIPQRPLYVAFLTLAHLVAGQDYDGMIRVQTVLFALFPVLLYLFGREFFGRPLGGAIALLAILRDDLSNRVAEFTGNLSYSKVYLSEIPTAILLILFLLLGMRWVRRGYPDWTGFLLGGVLGTAMLIRTQVIVALPVLLLFALLARCSPMRRLLRSGTILALTLAVVVAPWLWRNWRLTGDLIFDSPESQTINLALRYSRLNGLEPQVMPLPGESSAEYVERLNRIARKAVIANPWGALRGVANSFLNHAVNNLLLFPVRNDLKGWDDLWVPREAFWETWTGRPTPAQSLMMSLYLVLLGVGISAAWIRNRWLGLLPLGLNLAYNLWTSLALLSGQRFMLTMDWSIYLYFMLGLFVLFGGFLSLLARGREAVRAWLAANPPPGELPPATMQRSLILPVGVLFLTAGLAPVAVETAFPQRYPPRPAEVVLAELAATPAFTQSGLNASCLHAGGGGTPLRIVQGRALYPRYYLPGDGERFTDAAGYKVTDEGRMVFDLVGQGEGRVIFPMAAPPGFFPHAADVILVADEAGIPWLAYVEQEDREALYISASPGASRCE
jgi:hypothetical protein